ncbi:hypothetical protein RB601_008088 [Gaeumannomyces tritici]
MALASATHSNDEYGWDLSREEEEELFATIEETTFAPTNVIATPRNPVHRAADSPGSGGSSSTVRTALRRPIARLPSTAPAEAYALRADIHAAFPRSPRTVTITDNDSVSEIESLGRRSPHGHGEDTPAHSRSVVYRGSRQARESPEDDEPLSPGSYVAEDVSYPDLTRALSAFDSASNRKAGPAAGPDADGGPPNEKKRSPLALLRTFPRKPFSVSDFSSAAWCEQQYAYTLFRMGGRKPRTEAMKRGTRVHEKLEREVHTTVRVEILSREDAFGLKIWNLVQGLRTLRDTGLTRELEVWGLVDGHVVNGIIDGLSEGNPDPEFEEEIYSSQGSSSQASQTARKVWVFEVKTRARRSVPSMSHMRPSMIQLFLYHRFLSQMVDGKVDFLHVYRRYGLDPDKPFSDTFLAEIGSLHDEVFFDASPVPLSPGSETDSIGTAGNGSTKSSNQLRYSTLRQLTALLKDELRQTFPDGSHTLGPFVTIEYRYHGKEPVVPTVEAEDLIDKGLRKKHRKKRVADEEQDAEHWIEHRRFHMNNEKLDNWLEGHMQWWRGERDAVGVSIEDADKCRSCQFSEDCGWVADMHKKAVTQAKENKKTAEAGKERLARRG